MVTLFGDEVGDRASPSFNGRAMSVSPTFVLLILRPLSYHYPSLQQNMPRPEMNNHRNKPPPQPAQVIAHMSMISLHESPADLPACPPPVYLPDEGRCRVSERVSEMMKPAPKRPGTVTHPNPHPILPTAYPTAQIGRLSAQELYHNPT
jgi:hypothetical protein